MQTICITLDGQQHKVSVRVAKIIHWLIDNTPKVDAPSNLKLVLDCSGETVKVTRQETETIDACGGH